MEGFIQVNMAVRRLLFLQVILQQVTSCLANRHYKQSFQSITKEINKPVINIVFFPTISTLLELQLRRTCPSLFHKQRSPFNNPVVSGDPGCLWFSERLLSRATLFLNCLFLVYICSTQYLLHASCLDSNLNAKNILHPASANHEH